MTISSTSAKTILGRLGWRVSTTARYTQALRDFQGGWNLGSALAVDGILGPKTSAALVLSESRRSKGQSTASAHFSFSEFACKCGGKYSACRRIAGEGVVGHKVTVLRALIQCLEVTRAAYYPGGLSIVSGYRCDSHNSAVGGASSSQHRWGAAADIARVVDKDTLRARRWFAGIGYQASSDRAQHVDRRDLSGVNPTRGSVSSPTTWRYS
jgi:zinc D-Ala-D-Ala carboxypeptidase